MESIIYIVMILSVLCVATKLSNNKTYINLFYGIIFSIIPILLKDYAIGSHKNQISSYISSTNAHNIIAILVTIELALLLVCTFREGTKLNERSTLNTKIRAYMDKPINFIYKYYVSLLSIPTIFYIETQLIYAFPGTDFDLIVYGLSLIILGFIVITPIAIKWLLPQNDMREDFHLIIYFILCLLALYSTNSNILLYKNLSEPINYKSGILAITILLIIFLLGFIIQKRKKFKLWI